MHLWCSVAHHIAAIRELFNMWNLIFQLQVILKFFYIISVPFFLLNICNSLICKLCIPD